jgi:hypothetical protein
VRRSVDFAIHRYYFAKPSPYTCELLREAKLAYAPATTPWEASGEIIKYELSEQVKRQLQSEQAKAIISLHVRRGDKVRSGEVRDQSGWWGACHMAVCLRIAT